MKPFDDDQAACCRFLFDPLDIRHDLQQDPEATRTEETCYRTGCTGRIWEVGSVGTELTCDTCATVLNESTTATNADGRAPPQWEAFWSHRSRHYNSGRPRCPGGFPVYEYNSDADEITEMYE